MKTIKSFLLLAAFAVIAANVSAQPFVKGQKDINLGIGLLPFYYGSGYTSVLPPLAASFEIGIADGIAEKGVIGIGGFIGYSTAKYEVNFNSPFISDYSWRYTWITVGGRGAFHYDFLDNPKLDTYAGLMLAIYIANATFKSDDPTLNSSIYSSPDAGGFGFSGFVGARYRFAENFGVYGELGYGWTLANVGINLKF